MRNSKLLRLIAAVVAALFFLAACGGGGSDDSADSDTSSTGDSDGGASDDAGSGDSDSTGSDDSDSDASSDDMSGSAASSWCDGAREISELADAIDAENLGMIATLERQMRELLPMQIALASQAPDEIAADVELFVDGLVQMQQTLEEADYNILDVNEEDMAVLDSPELNAASDRIEQYNEQVCGIDPDSGSDSDPSVGITDADIEAMLDSQQRDQILAPFIEMGLTEDQAVCVVRSVFSSGIATTPTNPEFLSTLEDCGLTLEDLARIGMAMDDGDASGPGVVDSDAMETLMAALPIFAGNPEMVPMIVEGLVQGGIPEEAAQCLGDALSAPDAAERLVDMAEVAAVLDDCGVSVEDLLSFAG